MKYTIFSLLCLTMGLGCAGAASTSSPDEAASSTPSQTVNTTEASPAVSGEQMARAAAATARVAKSEGTDGVMYVTSGATEVGGEKIAVTQKPVPQIAPIPLVVVLAGDGSATIDEKPITVEALIPIFADAATKKRPITIAPSAETKHEHVLKVIDIASKQGVPVSLKVAPAPPTQP